MLRLASDCDSTVIFRAISDASKSWLLADRKIFSTKFFLFFTPLFRGISSAVHSEHAKSVTHTEHAVLLRPLSGASCSGAFQIKRSSGSWHCASACMCNIEASYIKNSGFNLCVYQYSNCVAQRWIIRNKYKSSWGRGFAGNRRWSPWKRIKICSRELGRFWRKVCTAV